MAKDFFAATEYAKTSFQQLIELTWENAATPGASSKADLKVTSSTPEAPKV